jgi:hypothetical protein
LLDLFIVHSQVPFRLPKRAAPFLLLARPCGPMGAYPFGCSRVLHERDP